jgi:hypothetical protein
MCDFQPRDIVECIDDRPQLIESKVMPAAGQLYTVDRIAPVGGGHSIRLRELTPTCYLGGPCACGGCGWDADRFRKVYRPDDRLIAELTTPVAETV